MAKLSLEEQLSFYGTDELIKRMDKYCKGVTNSMGIKNMQGLESEDIVMSVFEKMFMNRSWEKSRCVSFIDFLYGRIHGELSHFKRSVNGKKYFSMEDYMMAYKKKFVANRGSYQGIF